MSTGCMPTTLHYLHAMISVLVCVCVCVVEYIQARSAYQMGRHEDAAIAIRSAKTFNRWSIIVNILIVVFIFVIQLAWMIPFFIAVATAEANSENNDYDN